MSLVPGESLSLSTKINSVLEKYLSYKLISILKRVKNQTGLDSNTYKSMYPTGCVPLSGGPEPQESHKRSSLYQGQ